MGTPWQLIAELDALARAAGDRGLLTVIDAPAELTVGDGLAEAILGYARTALEAAVADPSARIVLVTLGTEGDDVVLDVLHDGLGDGACRRYVVTRPAASVIPLPRPGAPHARAPRPR